jgi:hypothetical protein
MPLYTYEQVPGIDHLRRHNRETITLKQVASAAAQYGRARILCEINVHICGISVVDTSDAAVVRVVVDVPGKLSRREEELIRELAAVVHQSDDWTPERQGDLFATALGEVFAPRGPRSVRVRAWRKRGLPRAGRGPPAAGLLRRPALVGRPRPAALAPRRPLRRQLPGREVRRPGCLHRGPPDLPALHRRVRE